MLVTQYVTVKPRQTRILNIVAVLYLPSKAIDPFYMFYLYLYVIIIKLNVNLRLSSMVFSSFVEQKKYAKK